MRKPKEATKHNAITNPAPDWGGLMSAIQQGKKLRHVNTNDRSRPVVNANMEENSGIKNEDRGDDRNIQDELKYLFKMSDHTK